MKRFMKLPVLGGVLLIILGIILIIRPRFSMQVIMICIGSVFLIRGIISLLTYFSSRGAGIISRSMLIQSFIDLGFGLLIVFGTKFISSAIAIVLGLWALITGGIDLVMTLKSRDITPKKHWNREIISSSIQMVFGVVCIISPMWGFSAVMILCGIAVLLSGIATIFFSSHFLDN